MSDYAKLKELAEALESATSRYMDDETNNELGDEWSLANDRYVDASSPEVVLGLIADLEGFMQGAKVEADAADEARAEARRLKAENAQLKNQEIELKAETLRAVNAHLDLFELYGERGNQVDQIKAECEGLRRELAEAYPFRPVQDAPTIGYTGCVICGQYTDHGGLQCPKTLAFSLARDNQRVITPEPLITGPHPLDAKGDQRNG